MYAALRDRNVGLVLGLSLPCLDQVRYFLQETPYDGFKLLSESSSGETVNVKVNGEVQIGDVDNNSLDVGQVNALEEALRFTFFVGKQVN